MVLLILKVLKENKWRFFFRFAKRSQTKEIICLSIIAMILYGKLKRFRFLHLNIHYSTRE